jgi:hypothetical protein
VSAQRLDGFCVRLVTAQRLLGFCAACRAEGILHAHDMKHGYDAPFSRGRTMPFEFLPCLLWVMEWVV